MIGAALRALLAALRPRRAGTPAGDPLDPDPTSTALRGAARAYVETHALGPIDPTVAVAVELRVQHPRGHGTYTLAA